MVQDVAEVIGGGLGQESVHIIYLFLYLNQSRLGVGALFLSCFPSLSLEGAKCIQSYTAPLVVKKYFFFHSTVFSSELLRRVLSDICKPLSTIWGHAILPRNQTNFQLPLCDNGHMTHYTQSNGSNVSTPFLLITLISLQKLE